MVWNDVNRQKNKTHAQAALPSSICLKTRVCFRRKWEERLEREAAEASPTRRKLEQTLGVRQCTLCIKKPRFEWRIGVLGPLAAKLCVFEGSCGWHKRWQGLWSIDGSNFQFSISYRFRSPIANRPKFWSKNAIFKRQKSRKKVPIPHMRHIPSDR